METNNAANAELLERLDEGKSVLFTPQGISMLPFIRGGRDKVLVGKEENISVGDIVLAIHDDHLILHRVYAIDGGCCTLMGDGNLKGTEAVDKSEVKGKVLEIVNPNGRRHKPHKAWLWRHSLPCRRIFLKLRRKWCMLWNKDPE